MPNVSHGSPAVPRTLVSSETPSKSSEMQIFFVKGVDDDDDVDDNVDGDI